jgi:hypothetical protein
MVLKQMGIQHHNFNTITAWTDLVLPPSLSVHTQQGYFSLSYTANRPLSNIYYTHSLLPSGYMPYHYIEIEILLVAILVLRFNGESFSSFRDLSPSQKNHVHTQQGDTTWTSPASQ